MTDEVRDRVERINRRWYAKGAPISTKRQHEIVADELICQSTKEYQDYKEQRTKQVARGPSRQKYDLMEEYLYAYKVYYDDLIRNFYKPFVSSDSFATDREMSWTAPTWWVINEEGHVWKDSFLEWYFDYDLKTGRTRDENSEPLKRRALHRRIISD